MAAAVDQNSGFAACLNVQLRVLRALFMHEVLTRYGRHNIGFLWLFVGPMIYTLGVTALWTAIKSVHGSNLPIVACALQGSLSLLYHCNVRLLDVHLARLMLEFGGASISSVTLSLEFITLSWLTIAWFGSALANWLGALSHVYELVDKIWHPVSYLIFPLSGSAFMVDALLQIALRIVLWILMVDGLEIVREGYFGAAA